MCLELLAQCPGAEDHQEMADPVALETPRSGGKPLSSATFPGGKRHRGWHPRHQPINWRDSLRASDNLHTQRAFPMRHSKAASSEPMKENIKKLSWLVGNIACVDPAGGALFIAFSHSS